MRLRLKRQSSVTGEMTDNGEGKVLLGLVKHVKTDRMLDFLIQLSSGFLLNMTTWAQVLTSLASSLALLAIW